jgi:hypothetical protein
MSKPVDAESRAWALEARCARRVTEINILNRTMLSAGSALIAWTAALSAFAVDG